MFHLGSHFIKTRRKNVTSSYCDWHVERWTGLICSSPTTDLITVTQGDVFYWRKLIIPSHPVTVHSKLNNSSCLAAFEHLPSWLALNAGPWENSVDILSKCEANAAFSPHLLPRDGTTGTIWSHLRFFLWVLLWTSEHKATLAFFFHSVYFNLLKLWDWNVRWVVRRECVG